MKNILIIIFVGIFILTIAFYWSKEFNKKYLPAGPSCRYFQEATISIFMEKNIAEYIVKSSPVRPFVELPYVRIVMIFLEAFALYLSYEKFSNINN